MSVNEGHVPYLLAQGVSTGQSAESIVHSDGKMGQATFWVSLVYRVRLVWLV